MDFDGYLTHVNTDESAGRRHYIEIDCYSRETVQWYSLTVVRNAIIE